MLGVAWCPVCGLPYKLRKDGRIRNHDRLVLAYSYGSRDRRMPCPGSSQLPKVIG